MLYSTCTDIFPWSYFVMIDFSVLLNKLNFFPSSVMLIFSVKSKPSSSIHLIFLYAVLWEIPVSLITSFTDVGRNVALSKIFTISLSAKAVRIACLNLSRMTIIVILLTITNAKHLLILLLIVVPLDLKVFKYLTVHLPAAESAEARETPCFPSLECL